MMALTNSWKLAVLFAAVAFGQYIQTGAIGTVRKEEPVSVRPNYPFIPVEHWVGQRILFMPTLKSMQKFGYLDFAAPKGSRADHPAYDEFVGKIARITAVRPRPASDKRDIVVEIEGTGQQLIGTIDTYNSLGGILFLDELDRARVDFIGKVLWLKVGTVGTYDPQTDKTGFMTAKKCGPLKVTNVLAGTGNIAPLRFIVTNQAGDEGYVDVAISGTNLSPIWDRMLAKDGLPRGLSFIDKRFFFSDPRKDHDWPSAVWAAIENETVDIGMTKEQVKFSLGEPKSINYTSTAERSSEQWVYERGSFVYFDGDIVKAIQN
jgi:hypothetical protein